MNTFPGVSDELAAKAAANVARLPESVRNLMFALMASPDDAGLAACLADELTAYCAAPPLFQSRGAIAGALEEVKDLADLPPILAALTEGAELPPQIVYVPDNLRPEDGARIAEFFRHKAGNRPVLVMVVDSAIRPTPITAEFAPYRPEAFAELFPWLPRHATGPMVKH